MPKKKDEQLREAKVVETPDTDQEEFIPDDSMMLPNEGQAFHDEEESVQDEELKQEKDEDRAMFQGNEPLIQAVFEWMDNEIKDTDSIKTARAVAKEYKITIEHAIAVCDIVSKVIEGKRLQFQNIYDNVNTKETNS